MAANATDERLHFSAKIGGSILLTVDTTARHTSDSIGALPPGKYFLHAVTLTGRCWIRTNKFVAGGAAVAVAPPLPAAGVSAVVNEFPLDATSGIRSLTFHVRQGINDRLEAICEAGGSATLVLTKTGD